jgi:hypothetical protein
MDDDIRQFGTGLGQRVIAQDWACVDALLAPWFQAAVFVYRFDALFRECPLTQANGGVV